MSYQQQNINDDRRGHYEQRPETVTYTNQQSHPNDVHYRGHNRSDGDFRRSGYDLRGSKYDDYQKKKNYKYNFFSMLDEPWNRRCEYGTCGSCPANECIAKKEPKLDWL